MDQIIDIIRFATIGCLVLLAVQIGRSGTVRKQALPAVGFCLGVLSYLLVEWEPMQQWHYLFFPLLAPTFATPFLFWLFSKSLFDDGFSFRKWMPWALTAVIAFFYVAFIANRMDSLGWSESTKTIFSLGQQAVALLFVALAIVEASRDRESDLVLSRLQFRNAFILCAAILLALTILSELTFKNGESPVWMEFLQKTVIAGLTFYFALQRLNFKPGFFDEPESVVPPQPKPAIDHQLAAQLIAQMEGEKCYRTEGLTIRQLAEKMDVKEYKLRQTINQHLGFRNFNDFLNSYRIQEACDLLTDPQRKDFTILEIAFEMGYNSLAPFNKAFKSTTGMTPTEWRRKGNLQ